MKSVEDSCQLCTTFTVALDLVSTDNQHRVSEDRFLVMTAFSPDLIRRSSKENIDQAWKKVLKNKSSKSKAEYMEHQWANHCFHQLAHSPTRKPNLVSVFNLPWRPFTLAAGCTAGFTAVCVRASVFMLNEWMNEYFIYQHRYNTLKTARSRTVGLWLDRKAQKALTTRVNNELMGHGSMHFHPWPTGSM